MRYDFTLLTDPDLYLFNEGSHFHLYDKLGAHPVSTSDVTGTYFSVWAPNAERVCVIGDFNSWDTESHPLRARGSAGIWEGTVPSIGPGVRYKYHIVSRYNDYRVNKADPFASAPAATGRQAQVPARISRVLQKVGSGRLGPEKPVTSCSRLKAPTQLPPSKSGRASTGKLRPISTPSRSAR